MKKIMFNDKYGLTESVLTGRKTMTRRIATELNYPLIEDISEWGQDDKCRAMLSVRYSTGLFNDVYPHYQPGEIVAVAQSYEQIYLGFSEPRMRHDFGMRVSAVHHTGDLHNIAGWTNKMFVNANLMPNRIQITNVKYERLQDISDEDCAKEGIIHVNWRQYLKQDMDDFGPQPYKDHDLWTLPIFEESFRDAWAEQKPGEYAAESAKVAFAVLIFKLMGKKVWEQNPWVFAYEFELVR